jgi:hypothetical protein
MGRERASSSETTESPGPLCTVAPCVCSTLHISCPFAARGLHCGFNGKDLHEVSKFPFGKSGYDKIFPLALTDSFFLSSPKSVYRFGS